MKKKQITLKPLRPNIGIVRWYSSELKKLVRIMVKAVTIHVQNVYKRSEVGFTASQDEDIFTFEDVINQARNVVQIYIDDNISEITAKLVDKINLNSNISLTRSLRDVFTPELGISGNILEDAMTAGVRLACETSIIENVSLIQSIADDYFAKITGNVTRAINGGLSYSSLIDEFQKLQEQTTRRAELIATDQVHKAFTSINLRRMDDAGITHWKWVHSGGGRNPRKWHVHLGQLDKVYTMDNPPIIDDKTGERGFPAQLVNCRCVLAPVVEIPE